jgi:hypothetical protein
MVMMPLLAALFVVAPAGPVTLARKYTANEKLAYAVKATLNAEHRGGSLETWIPEDLDITYTFATQTQALKADGIAQILYTRPTFTITEGETFTSPPKSKVDKLNQTVQLTMSPINEILDVKDLTPKKKKTRLDLAPVPGRQAMSFLGDFIGEVQRLSLFVGSFDSALDLAPRLPLDEVKVGDTWKRTVSYQPQKLKSKDNKQVVQRLDYTYTYKGVVASQGKQVQRVEATLEFSNDLAEFFNQTVEMTSEDTGLKKIPLKLSAKILFDLDLKSGKTIFAEANGVGGFQIFTTEDDDQATYEEKYKGRTTLQLVGTAMVPPTTKK